MAQIISSTGMRDYIKQQLGYPVINVELANAQIDQIILDSVDVFNRYNIPDGSHFEYVILTLTSGTSEYNLSADNIQGVVDFRASFGVDGINTLFSPTHMLLYNNWVAGGNYPGGGGSGSGMVVAEYQIAMEYLKTIELMFGVQYKIHWRESTNTLMISPTPKTTITGVLQCYKKSSAMELYNHPLFKQYCIAKSKALWGFILGKVTINLPGGGTINGQDIKAEGRDDAEKVLEQIKGESQPIDFFIG